MEGGAEIRPWLVAEAGDELAAVEAVELVADEHLTPVRLAVRRQQETPARAQQAREELAKPRVLQRLRPVREDRDRIDRVEADARVGGRRRGQIDSRANVREMLGRSRRQGAD